MAFSAMSRSRTVAAMNITPLVDVMLVMLIIFMVSTPLLTRTLALDFSPAPDTTPQPEPVTLRIEADGSVIWNRTRLPASVVDAALRLEAGRDTPPVLAIEADEAADYQLVTHWMARARMAGLDRISL